MSEIATTDFSKFGHRERKLAEQILKVWNGGLASHGGVVGGLVGLFLFLRKYPQYHWVWLLDGTALVIFIPAALIRLGNLFNSELYGKITDVPWAFVFTRNFEFTQYPRHPAQLYEALACLVLCFLLFLRHERYFVVWYSMKWEGYARNIVG